MHAAATQVCAEEGQCAQRAGAGDAAAAAAGAGETIHIINVAVQHQGVPS